MITERQKLALMWLVAALAFFIGVWACLGRNHPRFEWRGAGAADLLAREPTLKNGMKIFTAPLAPIQVVPRPKVTLYFAATATDRAGLESDYSNEVSLPYTNGMRKVTLAWDASPSTNEIADYRVYRGLTSAVYTASYSAGTNLQLTVPIVREETNLVIRVSTVNGTELVQSRWLDGPWFRMYTTNWVATNPPGAWFFRAVGSGSRVEINTEWR